MKKKLFTVMDTKAEYCMEPFTARTVGEAERSFQQALKGEESPMAKNPEDYCLFLIGEYNQETGQIIGENTPVSIGSAINYVNQLRNATIDKA